MKELPATLILRPFNFDTLATQTYLLAKDERLAEAALPSLAIVAVGLSRSFYWRDSGPNREGKLAARICPECSQRGKLRAAARFRGETARTRRS